MFTKNTNITTKLNRNLFTKVISTKQEVWVCLDRESNAEKHKHFNLVREGWVILIERVKHRVLKFRERERESRECSLRSKYW